MGIYGEFDYGTGIVYGERSRFIIPSTGPVTGGTEVVITGENYLNTSLDDPLDDGVLDPVLWSSSLTGIGSSANETTALRLQCGPLAASSAVVTGLTGLSSADIEVEFSVVSPILALPAPGDVDLAALRLSVDGANYVQISRKTGVADRYEAVIVVGGVTLETGMLAASDLSGSLRIIRDGAMVYLYAGTKEVLRGRFVSTAAVPVLRVDNLAAAYSVVADFSAFLVHTMVVFDGEPALDAMVSPAGDRIFVTTPVGRTGSATVHIATALTSLDAIVDGFVYADPDLFLIHTSTSLGQGIVLSITSDSSLRNLRAGRPGLLR